jgi:hypothetical protein
MLVVAVVDVLLLILLEQVEQVAVELELILLAELEMQGLQILVAAVAVQEILPEVLAVLVVQA